MVAKIVPSHVTLWAMEEVSLPQLLREARAGRSLREMARRSGLSVMTIKRLEDGDIDLPTRETMAALSEAYDTPLDDLARAAYRTLFRRAEVTDRTKDVLPTDDAAPFEVIPAAESNEGKWAGAGRTKQALATSS
jgi:transcriptional regulator with XRE-family HTH domain